MKATYLQLAAALALTFGIAACVPASKPAPAPAPAPVARPAPARPAPAPVLQAPPSDSWIDAALTQGTWRYSDQNGGGMALFAPGRGEPLVMLECDRETGPAVMLFVASQPGGAALAVVRTETATRSLALSPVPGGQQASLDPRDPLLDAMALSKGRFAVEVEGLPPLILPSHAEVSRVIEDCR